MHVRVRGQTVGRIKMKLGMQVGLGRGHIMLDRVGTQLCLQKGGGAPKFSAHLYRGQTAGWTKMVLGMEVGLSPGEFVLDGDPAPSPKGVGAPSLIFGPFLLWPNGWMHQDATWYGDRPRPRRLCVRRGLRSLSPKMGRSPRPNFRPIFIEMKRLDGSRWF